MMYGAMARRMPGWLRRYVLAFETRIEEEVGRLAAGLPGGALVLDAGAGEARFASLFTGQRYLGVDLAVGDPSWDYSRLNVIGDLERLPLASGAADAVLNIVTLEHVREPAAVMRELARVLKPGGVLLLVAPQEWEMHQIPHDYYRYTRYGLEHLARQAGLTAIDIRPVGGLFRLLSRRLLNALQFFPGPFFWVAALFLAPPALVAPLFDGLDRQRHFTLGYVCTAQKPA